MLCGKKKIPTCAIVANMSVMIRKPTKTVLKVIKASGSVKSKCHEQEMERTDIEMLRWRLPCPFTQGWRGFYRITKHSCCCTDDTEFPVKQKVYYWRQLTSKLC